MSDLLPQLVYADLVSTRDYLRDVALVLGSLQRAFLPPNPHDWQHGLEVVMRGISTQAFTAGDEKHRASMDFVQHKFRLGGLRHYSLERHAAPELLEAVQAWVKLREPDVLLEQPEFAGGQFNRVQADAYMQALWWMDEQFRSIKQSLKSGLASPVLLYPHHFDLALTWFPFDDERQLTLGWSTGDDTITEPYLYGTAYPAIGLERQPVPEPAYHQQTGFTGMVLLHQELAAHNQPEALLAAFARALFKSAKLYG